jgi:hypothetical protein
MTTRLEEIANGIEEVNRGIGNAVLPRMWEEYVWMAERLREAGRALEAVKKESDRREDRSGRLLVLSADTDALVTAAIAALGRAT